MAAHDVRLHRTGVKQHLHHPVVGDLDLTYEGMELTLFVYTAEPRTPSEDGRKMLASWAGTQELEDSARADHQTIVRARGSDE